MSIKQAISLCDSSSAEELTEIYWHYQDSKDFEQELIKSLKHEKLQGAASWMLKHHLEQGFMLRPKLVNKVFAQLQNQAHWEAQLHLLQCLPMVDIPVDSVSEVMEFLDNNLTNSNKLVRAWVYNGIHEIAKANIEYLPKAKALFMQALESDVPSVQARIRNIVKSGLYD